MSTTLNLILKASDLTATQGFAVSGRGGSEQFCGPGTLYDDFSGDLSLWTQIAGTWEIANDELMGKTNGGGIITSSQGQNISIHGQGRMMSATSEYVRFFLNVTDMDNYYMFTVTALGSLIIYKNVAGGFTQLATTVGSAIEKNTNIAMSFQNDSGQLTGWVNDVSVTVNNMELSGTYAGCQSGYYSTWWDNISIGGIDEATPIAETSIMDLGASVTVQFGSIDLNSNLNLNAPDILVQYAIGDSTPPTYNGTWLTVAELQAVGNQTGRYLRLKYSGSAAPYIFTMADSVLPIGVNYVSTIQEANVGRYIYQDIFKDGMGAVVEDGNITVYLAGATTLATIYEDETGGSAVTDSLVQSNSRGYFSFYVDASDYTAAQKFKIQLSKTNFTTQTYDDIRIFPHERPSFATFTAADATPSVKGGECFKTANTAATTITDFDDGYDGQEIIVVINDAYTTIDFTGTNLKGNAGADWSPGSGDHMVCRYDVTSWYCSVHDNTA